MRRPIHQANMLKFQPGDLPEGLLYGNEAFRYPEDPTVELHSFTRQPFDNLGSFALLALSRKAPNTVNWNYQNTGTLSGPVTRENIARVADGSMPLDGLRYLVGAEAPWLSLDFNVPRNYRIEEMVGFLLRAPGLLPPQP